MDKKSKIIFIILGILIVISVILTYYRTMVIKDYELFYDDYGEEYLEGEAELEE